MDNGTPIKYTLAPLKSNIAAKSTSYIGQIVHNALLGTGDVVERYAAKYGMSIWAAQCEVGRMVEFIESEVAQGNRLDFGSFAVSLKMTGTFAHANAPYSAKDNPVRVVMTPKKALHAAAAKLNPFDGSLDERPRIVSVFHQALKPEDGGEMNLIRLNGGLTTMNVMNCKVDASRADEGVWLASADGKERLLKATVRESTLATCDVVFPESDLPAGDYRVEICSRVRPTDPLASVSRKVVVRRG